MNTSPQFPIDLKLGMPGTAVIELGGSDQGYSVNVQPDGKIVVAGHSGGITQKVFGLIRLNPNGSLDTSFNDTGKVIISVGSGTYMGSNSATIQPDGKIVVASTSYVNGSNNDYDFSLIRLNTNGSLDTSFNRTGKAIIDLGAGIADYGQSVTLQSDGKIVVAGYSERYPGSNPDFSLIRLNPNGSLDTSFNGTGKAIFTTDDYSSDESYSVTVQSDGKIVVAGDNKSDFKLTRLNANGSLDTSFNGTGKAIIPVGSGNDYGRSVTLQSDGKIVMAGFSLNQGDVSLIRLNANGSLDTSFNGTGKAIIPVGSSVDYGYSVTVQPDGKIVVAGSSEVVDSGRYNRDTSLIRLNANGSLDTSFNGTGKAIIPVGSGNDYGQSVTLQSDGKIVVAGTSYGENNSNANFSVIRLNADGSLDTSFNADLNSLGGSVSYVENAAAIALDSTVVIVDAELGALNGGLGNYAGASVTLARQGGANAQDLFSALGNLSFSGSNAVLAGITIGTVSNAQGRLSITFNSAATQAAVNEVLSSIGYSNSSDAPPASVQVGWTFNDGNTGAQGVGGALTGIGSTTVNITAVNDAPTGIVTVSGTAIQGQTLTAANTLADADGLFETISYQWLADGQVIGGANSSALTLGPAQVGKAISVRASYSDDANTYESVTSSTTALVASVGDTTAPSVVTFSPTDGAAAVLVGSNIVVTFSEAIQRGTGSIVLKNAANVVVATYDAATSSNLSISGSTLTINPTADLANSTNYFVTFASGAIKDLAGNSYSGITTYDFTTAAAPDTTAPTVTAFSPTDGATGVLVGANIVVTFSEAIQRGTGSIVLKDAANTVIATYDAATSTNLSISGSTLTINPTADLGYSTNYFVNFASDTIKDLAGNSYAGTTAYDFTTVPIPNVNAAPSFAPTLPGTGKAIIPVGASYDKAYSMTLQADGKILVAGNSSIGDNRDFSLIRLNANGSLDTNFDGDGKVIIPVGTSNDFSSAMMLQADGKILMAGYSQNGNSQYDFSLIRLNANGSLDNSFDGDGKAIIPLGTSLYASASSMTLQADGKILLAGGAGDSGSNAGFSLIRLNPNGSLDPSFDGDGKVIIPVGTSYVEASAITLQADGKILVAGTGYHGSSYDFSLIRLNANGTLDTSFDADGKAIIPVGTSSDFASAMTLQSDGKILVAGSTSSNDFSLIRLNANGSLDTSFDGDGKAIIPVGTLYAFASAMTLQADGKILVAGISGIGNNSDFSLIRLNADGSLDTSFDGDGKAIIPMGASFDEAYALTLQPDGKILVAGYSFISDIDSDFSLIRLNADGSLDTSFGANRGVATLGGTVSYLENALAIALDTTVAISDAELSALNNGQGNYSGASVTLTRNTGANAQDVFGASGNLSFSGGNAFLSGTTIGSVTQSGGTLAITFNSNATQARVNEALSSLTYANNSDAPPASVQINWTFSDGNLGAQGSGGALAATGSTTVNITAVNDAPTGSVTVSGTATQGQTLTAANTLADLDGLGSISYQWLADGQVIGGATGATLTLAQAQVGKAISVRASYTDGGNPLESVTSNTTALVSTPPDTTAPTVSTFSPTDGATAVLVGANIVVTFSEAIQRGTGSIVLKDAANNVVATYDAATSSSLSISGATLTINPTADLANSTNYFVTFASGTIKDLAGNSYAGTAAYDFTTVAGSMGPTVWVGTSRADTFTGSSAADTITGGGGVDVLDGKGDSDLYIIATSSEHSAAEVADTGATGTDELRFTSINATTLTLFAGDTGLELVTIGTGTGAFADSTGTYAHKVNASAVLNALTIQGNNGDNTLTGTAYADNIVGNGGKDAINGGAGNDTLTGGLGIDTFTVASGVDTITDLGQDGADVLLVSAEATVNATLHTAWTATSKSLNNGTANINTNGLAVNLASVKVGNGFNVTNLGDATTLTGSGLADKLTGAAGKDILMGGAGTDAMDGGLDSDLYVIAKAADHAAAEVADTGAFGTDELRFTSITASTLVLFAGDTGLELVTIGTGTGASADSTGTQALSVDASAVLNGLTLIGNAGANALTGTNYNDSIVGGAGKDVISGGAGADDIYGGLGSDTLTGGDGQDYFVFDTAPNASSNKDTITDFMPNVDKIVLSKSIFQALSLTDVLNAADFFSSATAVKGNDASDRLVYNTRTGALYYDADGNGSVAAVQIAVIGSTNHPQLTHSDFLFVV